LPLFFYQIKRRRQWHIAIVFLSNKKKKAMTISCHCFLPTTPLERIGVIFYFSNTKMKAMIATDVTFFTPTTIIVVTLTLAL
jgi:hypothetical protein